MSNDTSDDQQATDETGAQEPDDTSTTAPASADEPGVAPHGMLEEDGPGGTPDGASSDGDDGPQGEGDETEDSAG